MSNDFQRADGVEQREVEGKEPPHNPRRYAEQEP